MPSVQGIGEKLTQPLYDTNNVLAAGTTQLTFFSVPMGQGGKTLRETNMTLAGQLQQGWHHDVHAISFHFPVATLLPAMKLILDGAFVQFNIGSKWFWQSSLRMLPGGVGINGFSDLGAAAALNAAYTNGIPDTRAVYTFRQPIPLESTEAFNVFVGFPTAVTPAADTPLVCVLHGELTRTVQ